MHTRIKELRKATGLTQSEFAEKIGFTKDEYVNIELGRVIPQQYFFRLLKCAYFANEIWLKFGSGEMFVCDKKQHILEVLKEDFKVNESVIAFLELYLSAGSDEKEIIDNFLTMLSKKIKEVPEEKQEEYVKIYRIPKNGGRPQPVMVKKSDVEALYNAPPVLSDDDI